MPKSITNRILSKSILTKNETKIINPPVQMNHELEHTVEDARVKSLDSWDLDRSNYVSVNMFNTVLARTGASDDLRAASTQPLWECLILTEDNAALDELGHKGMLESHDVNEVVLNVRTGAESLALVEDLRADQPGEAREQSRWGSACWPARGNSWAVSRASTPRRSLKSKISC